MQYNQQKRGCWHEFKCYDKPSNDVKTIPKFKESKLTIDDMKKEAEEKGWNAILINHDDDWAYFKQFEKPLKPKDLKKTTANC